MPGAHAAWLPDRRLDGANGPNESVPPLDQEDRVAASFRKLEWPALVDPKSHAPWPENDKAGPAKDSPRGIVPHFGRLPASPCPKCRVRSSAGKCPSHRHQGTRGG